MRSSVSNCSVFSMHHIPDVYLSGWVFHTADWGCLEHTVLLQLLQESVIIFTKCWVLVWVATAGTAQAKHRLWERIPFILMEESGSCQKLTLCGIDTNRLSSFWSFSVCNLIPVMCVCVCTHTMIKFRTYIFICIFIFFQQCFIHNFRTYLQSPQWQLTLAALAYDLVLKILTFPKRGPFS